VICFWCLSHWLELSIKDALSGSLFRIINELLLQIYYIDKKSQKNVKN